MGLQNGSDGTPDDDDDDDDDDNDNDDDDDDDRWGWRRGSKTGALWVSLGFKVGKFHNNGCLYVTYIFLVKISFKIHKKENESKV